MWVQPLCWLSGNSRPAGYVFFNGFYIIACETEQTDWQAYSKAWHRAHGPKKWKEDRRLELYQPGRAVEKIHIGERWSNNSIFEALSKRFKIEKKEYTIHTSYYLLYFYAKAPIRSYRDIFRKARPRILQGIRSQDFR